MLFSISKPTAKMIAQMIDLDALKAVPDRHPPTAALGGHCR